MYVAPDKGTIHKLMWNVKAKKCFNGLNILSFYACAGHFYVLALKYLVAFPWLASLIGSGIQLFMHAHSRTCSFP